MADGQAGDVTEPVVTDEMSPLSPETSIATEICPNCGADLKGLWCYHCGQNQKRIDRYLISIIGDSFDDIFAWDSRAAKTVVALLFRPGFLTKEYFAGRRARYVPPFRLYLIASVIFFSILSLQVIGTSGDTPLMINSNGINVSVDIDDEDEKEIEKAIGDDGGLSETLANIDKLDTEWLTAEANQAIRDRLKSQARKAHKMAREDPWSLVNALLDVAPPVLFIILPLFALLLKIVYLGSGRYYTEHLVLAVHNHSFLYVILSIQALVFDIEDFLPFVHNIWIAIQIWIPIYMFISLKTVYKQGYFVTFLKYCFIGLSYNIIFFLGILLAFLLGVLTL